MSRVPTFAPGGTYSPPSFASSWALTGMLSPRPTARVAVHDIDGQLLNEYAGSRRLSLDAPATPWAMYLAGPDRRYRFLAFDLDAKGGRTAADADHDARALAVTLHEAGLPPVICESGPSGGRHVWVGLADSVDPETVATLARLLKHSHPALDIAPLTNAATGCVRPPGAPHRHGGVSTVLSGLLDTLTHPTASAVQVRALVERLAGELTRQDAAQAPAGPLPVDEQGRLFLPGPRRTLPAGSAQALQEDCAAGDASSVLWRVLIGAASAHWRFAEIAALVATAPGLEHARTRRERDGKRYARGAVEATALLRRQWDKAARWAAAHDRQIGDDPTFDLRADRLAALVRQVQERADASMGRWTRGSGPTDRRVLDLVCLLVLEGMSVDVEADVRRLGLRSGISKDTSSKALWRLAADGWVVRTRASEGCRAAHWSIDPQGVLHREFEKSLTQADPRPPGAGAAERLALISLLTARLEAACHDAFTPGPGMGALAGNTYARLTDAPKSTSVLAAELGTTAGYARALLDRLHGWGLADLSVGGWSRPAQDRRDVVARQLGVRGRLADRARLYRLERAVWAWWLAERAWMDAPRPAAGAAVRGAQGPGPVQGLNTRGRYPRYADSGRADHHQARVLLAAGTTALGTPLLSAA